MFVQYNETADYVHRCFNGTLVQANNINKQVSNSVEEIHLVGTINNVETSYFTQLKITENMLPNDNVSMCVGHLDHVMIVYSSMSLGNIFSVV